MSQEVSPCPTVISTWDSPGADDGGASPWHVRGSSSPSPISEQPPRATAASNAPTATPANRPRDCMSHSVVGRCRYQGQGVRLGCGLRRHSAAASPSRRAQRWVRVPAIETYLRLPSALGWSGESASRLGRMAGASRSAVGLPLLFVLALLASVAPFGSDLYLAAFPDMRADLEGSETTIQLTLTMFLLGMAGGQLVFGPLSDRVGRRRPLLAVTAVFVLAGIGAAVAPTLGVLLAARLLQGLSAAAGMVLGRAVIADLSTGQAAARAFTLLMLIAGVAPVVAPVLGSALVDHIGWRGVLVVLAGLAVAMFAGSALLVPETLPRAQRNLDGGIAWGELARGRYLWATGAYTFSFCVMMAYISASPFLYQELIGMSALAYGALFALNAFGLMLTNALGARLLRRYHAQTVLGVGIAWLFLASMAILALALSPVSVAWLPVPIFFV